MRNEFLKFGDRLEYLMKTKGYTGRGKSTRLAEAFIDEGYIIVEENNRKRKIQDTKRSIDIHLNYDRCVLQGIWMDRYCRFFECSADFLMGYIDSPTHEKQTVTKITGFHEKTVHEIMSMNATKKILLEIIITHKSFLDLLLQYQCLDDSQIIINGVDNETKEEFVHSINDISVNGMSLSVEAYKQAVLKLIQACLDSLPSAKWEDYVEAWKDFFSSNSELSKVQFLTESIFD